MTDIRPVDLDAFPFYQPPPVHYGWLISGAFFTAVALAPAAARWVRDHLLPAPAWCREPAPPRWEIRDRSWHDGPVNLDGSAPSRPYLTPAPDMTLVDVLREAEKAGRTVDVHDNGRYVVTYSGGCPAWWLPHLDGSYSHDLSSLGWCHTCLDEHGVYTHHLALPDEIAVLTETAITDKVLRRQCEADGMTAAEYAASVAGKAIAKDGYDSLATRIVPGGTFLSPAGMMRQYTAHMKDARTVVRVAVPYDNREYLGYTRDFWEARDAAERVAYDQRTGPKPCTDCRGTKGHAHDCYVTKDIEFYTGNRDFAREFFAEHPEHLYPELAAALAEETAA